METCRTKPVGILHVLWSLGVGGAEKLAYDMIRSLPDDRFRPVVCSVEQFGFLGERLRASGYPVYHRKSQPGMDMGMVRWLRGIIEREQIEVIHAHQYSPVYYSALAATGNRRLNLVYTEHGRLYPDRRNWKKFLINPLLAKRINHLVSISESTRKAMECIDNFPGKRIRLIHNGVRLHDGGSGPAIHAKRHELGIPDGFQVVGSVSRLDDDKNLPMMLRAFKRILQRQPRCCLVLAGSGSEGVGREADLRSLAAELGIAEKVRFIGQRDDVREIYALMDVFLLCSYTEGICIALLEAMQSSTPCVVTKVGGNLEVVVDGVTGYFVASEDDESMAVRTLSLLLNPGVAEAMGRTGRERVAASFSFDGMMKQYLELYGRT